MTKKGSGGRNYGRGKKDGRKEEYKPPHSGLWKNYGLGIHSKPELKEIDDYNKGFRKGRSEKKKGGCFLTSACVDHAGLPDSCHELTVLRSFRDNYVAKLHNGFELIEEYYEKSPVILEKIYSSGEAQDSLQYILEEVRISVELIQAGDQAGAMARYSNMYMLLKDRFSA